VTSPPSQAVQPQAHAETVPPSTAVADVLSLYGLRGWLSPPLHGFHVPSQPVLGSALTVQLEPSDGTAPPFEELYELLSTDLSGRVIVIAGADDCHGGVWGQILSRAARRSGAVGALIAGRVRDVAALLTEDLPVWAYAQATVGPAGTLRIRAFHSLVQLGDVTVAPGSIVIQDSSGVVVLPSGGPPVERLLENATDYAAAESRVLAELADGVPLSEAYRHKRSILRRIRAANVNGGNDA
jgi:regulator of RNase E activity RraA